MLVELPRHIFKAAIERLSVLSESGKVKVDAYTHIRLETCPEGLRLSTYNRTMNAEILISEVRHDHARIVRGIPLQLVKDLCATLPEQDLISLEFAEATCLIRCGAVRFKTKVLLEDAFPKAKEQPQELRAVELQFLFQAFSLVQHCADPASQRTYAHGIILSKGKLSATDGMRLSCVVDHWLLPEKPAAIMLDTVTKLQKLFKGYARGSILIQNGEIFVSGGGVSATARLAAWQIPAIEKVIPKSRGQPIKLEKAELASALERALIVANEKMPQTMIHVGEGGVRVFTEEEGQTAEDILPVPHPVRSSTMVNPKYLLEAVNSVETESVLIEIGGSEVPMLITDEEGSHVNVVMPIQSTHG